ncbi:MAG: hypothetical protein ABI627_09970 [Polyangiaceae bacterium]
MAACLLACRGCNRNLSPSDGNCGTGEFVLGAAVGLVLAIALDAGVLAWDEPKRKERPSAQWGLGPTISSDGKRGEVRVFGTF